MAGQSNKSIEQTFKSIHHVTEATNSFQTMTETNTNFANKSSLNMQIDTMASSLEGVCKKLEEMQQTNASQFGKIMENAVAKM